MSMLDKASELICELIYFRGNKKPDKDVIKKLLFLNPAGNPEEMYRNYCIKRIRMVLITLLAGALLFTFMKLSVLTGSGKPDDGIERNEWNGKKQRIELYAIAGGEKLEVDIDVRTRILSEDELDSLCDSFLDELPDLIKGANRDLQSVSTDLVLLEEYEGYPFKCAWKSSDPARISAFGGSVDASRGEGEVLLTLSISYGDYRREMTIPVNMIKSGMTESRALEIEIEEYLKKSEEENRSEKIWRLPDSIAGHSIVWEYRTEDNSSLLAALFVIVAVIMYMAAAKDLSSKVRVRKEEMKKSYPKVLRKIFLYVGAGMTVKAAFTRAASDADGNGPGEAIYEEMRSACNEMKQGIGEAEVYERFGKRTGLGEYIKLAGLLSQNLKRGNARFLERLKSEADTAMKERVLEARKAGEEAQTKLLVPMLMMLAVVMVMIMIPAFTGMNI
ncbi:MAG: type II secretion system F family protein [Lachnospiraceae bacterium]|nr:type II secretion system F family protein [Lachnospiraceae bacterium]